MLTRLFQQTLRESKEEPYLFFRYPGDWSDLCQKEFGEERVKVIRRIHPREIPSFRKPWGKMQDLIRLYKYFQTLRPQAVIVNSLINTTPILAGRWAGVKVVLWAHEVPGMVGDPWKIRSGLIRKADFCVGVSQQVCAYLKLRGVAPEKIRCIPHGLPGLPSESEPPPPGKSLPEGVIKLGALAFWSPRKRLDLILEAAEHLTGTKSFREVQLHIGGPSDENHPAYRRWMEERLRFPPEKVTIRHWGLLVDPTPFFREIDALLVASDQEALPTVVLEAMVHLIPVFSFQDLPGVREIMGGYALLAEQRSPQALADAVVDFFRNRPQPSTYEQWRKGVWERRRLFSVERQWAAFRNILYHQPRPEKESG